MEAASEYECVIGLEVHAELKTQTKIFCSCPTVFGGEPNTRCCPVCAGLPGALPVLNRRAVELAVTAGLALGCEIAGLCRMDRKQYFYPDLPKGYQISQAEYPVCRGGHLDIQVGDAVRRIGITRIHLEEDAGKLQHSDKLTSVDCNRCGVPLIEIVSEPDLRSGAEAAAYLRELRGVLLACGVSDCKMQEGSLRCDINLSVRRKGVREMGTRTEIKNLNSVSFAEKAIAYEMRRQLAELADTGAVKQRTMRFDAPSGKTVPMREKEQTADYRFFPEPDLQPFRISPQTVERLRRELPELPAARRERFMQMYGLTSAEIEALGSVSGLTDFYERAAADCRYPKLAANLILSDLLAVCREEPFVSSVPAERISELAELAGDGTISRSVAKKLLLRLTVHDEPPRALAEREQLTQISEPERISQWIRETLEQDSKSVADYRRGKTNAIRALQGRVMALSGGRANPVLAEQLLLRALKSSENTKENVTHV